MKSKLLISLVILIPALVIAQAHRVDSPVVPETPSLVTSGAKGVGIDNPDSVPVTVIPSSAQLKPGEEDPQVGLDRNLRGNATILLQELGQFAPRALPTPSKP